MAGIGLFFAKNWKWILIGVSALALLAGVYFGIKAGLNSFESSIRNEERLTYKTEQLEQVLKEKEADQRMIENLNRALDDITSTANVQKTEIINRHTTVERYIEDNKEQLQSEAVDEDIKQIIRNWK